MSWAPAGAVPWGPQSTLVSPPEFPAGIPLSQQAYANWSKEIVLDSVWTATARSADDVVILSNWAHEHGYTVRARGTMHGWSPLTVVPGAPVDRVLLVDTMVHLNSVAVQHGTPSTVTAGAGASIEKILAALQDQGLGWANAPAIGELSIAGALAIGAHGATYPAAGETITPGQSYGSLSNLITAMTVVAWDASENSYQLREFKRSDFESTAFLTHLGRTFVTSVTLQAGENYRLRCQSFTDITWQELFAPPGSPGRTYESFVEASGRVEAIWFPFTATPWLKVWTPTPVKPPESREVHGPYNYFFSDALPEAVTTPLGLVAKGLQAATPLFGASQFGAVAAGLVLTDTDDLWGWSKDVLFYLRHTTLRVVAGGGAVITKRSNIARVVHEMTSWLNERMTHYASLGQYPVNMPFEVRLCGVDNDDEVLVDSAGVPDLSAVRPRADRDDWDTAIWMNVVSIPGTRGLSAFLREMEKWMVANYSGDYAIFRPEWSKGWAFTNDAAYQDDEFLSRTIPATFRAGGDGNWDFALGTFDKYDPHRVFSNTFIDRFMP
ncbi:cholesterol oxidase substrate-binding domain-containing protein [Rhodococcus sp. IEGM 1379]|uniref:cholesterol oxidase substrate-binding domain-containing protein n=1 Tax=Rhodococcus sp. IEGM 1379 TaxID=3047086 RepID=UPI0024B68C47|nr:cholesterol oxidase substrate-binding domain-containing protein [Rhodococcus sp. IEGM 1379]MDI9918865.1 cholesterol oxidase substrate-binding domain-containing protein [Rhodococcus sp. IEGM 1379]